jgi:hypothetical protein
MIFYQKVGTWKQKKHFVSKSIPTCKILLEAYIMDVIFGNLINKNKGIKEVTQHLLATKMLKEWL